MEGQRPGKNIDGGTMVWEEQWWRDSCLGRTVMEGQLSGKNSDGGTSVWEL